LRASPRAQRKRHHLNLCVLRVLWRRWGFDAVDKAGFRLIPPITGQYRLIPPNTALDFFIFPWPLSWRVQRRQILPGKPGPHEG
jgi:hypothetical protein